MTNTPKRGGPWGVLALLALLLAVPTLALAAKKAPNPNNGHGKITAVSATSITVTPKKGPAKTFTIDANTKVSLDDKPATVADLNTTQHAKIKSKDGVTALHIKAQNKGFKKANGGKGKKGKGGGKGTPIAPTPL